jgi:hypothetical protein
MHSQGSNFGIRLGRYELISPDQKGVAEVVPNGHFRPKLIFLFPKEGGGGGIKHFSDIPFFTNLPKFVQFFSNIFDN